MVIMSSSTTTTISPPSSLRLSSPLPFPLRPSLPLPLPRLPRPISCQIDVQVNSSSSSAHPDHSPSVGSRIRVLGPLIVYHVPKHPSFDLGGCEGELKDVLKTWKGKPISPNLPFKVQFNLELDGKPVKFFAHLKENEFEVIG